MHQTALSSRFPLQLSGVWVFCLSEFTPPYLRPPLLYLPDKAVGLLSLAEVTAHLEMWAVPDRYDMLPPLCACCPWNFSIFNSS